MGNNTRASRAGGILLIAFLVIMAVLVVLYFLESVLFGVFIVLFLILIIVAVAAFLTGIIAIPAYIMKDTKTESGNYSMDSIKSVEGEKNKKE